MKGNKILSITLCIVLAIAIVGFAMANSSILKATDEGDAEYGETVATDETVEGNGNTEYLTIPENTEAPSEETEAPSEETEAPSEETEAPSEETEAPSEETEAPTEETEAPTEAPVERSVKITASFVGGEFQGLGTEVVLTAVPTGYENPVFSWQFNDGSGWSVIEGETSDTFTYTVDENNYTYQWRVTVEE